MKPSTLVALMTTHQKAVLLRQVKLKLHVNESFKEALQDMGLIDHKDKLTEAGEVLMKEGLQV